MPSLLKSQNESSIHKGKLVGGAVVALTILAFFFLPEILGLHGNTSTPIDSEQANSQPPLAIAKTSPSPIIEELLQKEIASTERTPEEQIQEASIDRPIRTVEDVDRELALMQQKNKRAASPLLQQVSLANCAALVAEKPKKESLLPIDGPITWNSIKKPQVQTLLGQAKGNTQKLIGAVPPKYAQSHFELTSYLQALNVLTAKKISTKFSPEEALQFVDYRDAAVSLALIEDKVSRELLRQWQEISLEEILQKSFSQRKKEKLLKPFQPRMYLYDVVFLYDWTEDVREYRSRQLRANVKGYVIGDETSFIEWHYSSRPQERNHIGLSLPDSKGRRFFEIPYQVDVKRAVLSIVAVAGDESRYLKQYRFYPKAQALRAVVKKGGNVYLQVPTRPYPYNLSDKRVDRAFLSAKGALDKNGILLASGYLDSSPIATF